MTGARWYVVRTKPRSESLAAREMDRDDHIEIFSPLITSDQINNGQTPVPLFPGYIFMRLDPESNNWPSFRSGQHVLGLLNFDGVAPWLPEQVIDELKLRCDTLNEYGGIWRKYEPGDWVQVINSTLEGLAQVVEDGKSSNAPVRVLLHIFERLVPVQVSRHNLQPMESAPNRNLAPRRTRGGGRWIRGFGPKTLAST
jgi:transcriptional antiterminator RfaH